MGRGRLRDQARKIDYAKWPFPWGTASIDPYMCHSMAKYAKKQGIGFLDRVAVIDLLKDDGRIAAPLVSHRERKLHIFQSSRSFLPTGAELPT